MDAAIEAFNYRGNAYRLKAWFTGIDLEDAVADLTEAIRLDAEYAEADFDRAFELGYRPELE